MANDECTGGAPMQLEVGSPTELAEDEDSEMEGLTTAQRSNVKLEKRKRSGRGARDPAAVPVPGESDNDDDADSPSKRPSRGEDDDRPISGRELRALLFGHMSEMKESWKTFQGRLDDVEHAQKHTGTVVSALKNRTKVLEKDNLSNQQLIQQNGRNLDELTEEVKNMRVQFDEFQQRANSGQPCAAAAPRGPTPAGQSAAPPVPSDPWAAYLARRNAPAPDPSEREGATNDKDTLSDEEKRTLVVGGWLRDTRRTIIEEEIAPILARDDMKALIDSEKLQIFGPRRSVGMLKFTLRTGETQQDLRNRMWEVIKLLARVKLALPSTRTVDDVKTVWASFVKTKAARAKSAHVSMVRRVCIDLAMSAKNDQGAPMFLANTQFGSYDCDWNLGTIWNGSAKLASAVHKPPKEGEHVIMSGGWIHLDAIAQITGCTIDVGRIWLMIHVRGDILKIELLVTSALICVEDIDGVAWHSGIWEDKEISRAEEGWNEENSDLFHWVSYRHSSQWRGTGIGIAQDRLDSIIGKKACSRGIWILARIHGLGRVVLGSLHAHTGVTNLVYQQAIHEFIGQCPGKWRQYPLIAGIDANEVPCWVSNDAGQLECGTCSSNMNELVDGVNSLGCHFCPPRHCDKHTPTHFPRDEERSGRQIDVLVARMIDHGQVYIDPDRRHTIGTDHATLHFDIFRLGPHAKSVWGNDSRARWVTSQLPNTEIVDEDDIIALARQHTKPRSSLAYRDTQEICNLIAHAKQTGSKVAWKAVHRARRQARRKWQDDRLSNILTGDWEKFRQLQNEKSRKKGWWGKMLDDQSSKDLTRNVKEHLSVKMFDASDTHWDERLQARIDNVRMSSPYLPFNIMNVRTELQEMRCRSAVGPDGIGVHLLREIANHDHLSTQLVDLVNHIVETLQLPSTWEKSYLALLAKCDSPLKPKDLRPIAVSSAFNKLINRLVASRALPQMRRGSKISSCGRGRQTADLIGSVSRLRDVCREWRLPMLLCKLDVAGAFDRVSRDKVADLLCERLQRGAPESAELFGLLMDHKLGELSSCPQWRNLGRPFADLDMDMLFYQDDVFLVESDFPRLCRRIRVIDKCLQQVGLKLATNKTKIVASPWYRGHRKVKIGEDVFEVAAPTEAIRVLGLDFSLNAPLSQQSKELIARTRAAAHQHADILNAKGPWTKKVGVIRTLVESRFNWSAGAVHWAGDELKSLNTLQLLILRRAFALRRCRDESWVDWNSRTLRFCRQWIVAQQVPRWSTRVLTLQHTLHGHWIRRQEMDWQQEQPQDCPAVRALKWKCTEWWREQQALNPSVGARHPCRFYASCPERQLADCHGPQWMWYAADRQTWSAMRGEYLTAWDVKWTKGRQLAIKM
ncbi:pol [Symbiodinium sp. CCMP2592]|nr:pol [Symbiodinium sp. CCMP2592]